MSRLNAFLLLILFTASSGTARGVEPTAADNHYREAIKAVSAKDYTTALTEFELALDIDPDNLRFASDYRQAVILAKQYDRCLGFFEKLVTAAPAASNAYLNYGFAYVDKIPDAGAITQVILANKSLSLFSRSIELKPSWIAYYTRGNSSLFWPKIFGRTPLGVADLEEAMKLQKTENKRGFHVRAYIALGDGYWKMGELDKARTLWREGLAQFPGTSPLVERLAVEGDPLKALIDGMYDPNKRVDTNLHELWTD
ncbi:MAG: hypothetical protein HY315_07185 [Acidobacteria bacterium]|nr:hypothetical protein [Acidobacteriota bacterium]